MRDDDFGFLDFLASLLVFLIFSSLTYCIITYFEQNTPKCVEEVNKDGKYECVKYECNERVKINDKWVCKNENKP